MLQHCKECYSVENYSGWRSKLVNELRLTQRREIAPCSCSLLLRTEG